MGEDLPVERFNYRDRARRKLQSYCRDWPNAAWRRWYRVSRNRKRHLATLKVRRRRRIVRNKALVRALKSRPCADCGLTFPDEAMDFDHLGDKEELISKLVYTVSTWRLPEEIAKCEVVCSNCHRIRTTARIRSSADV